MSKFRFLCVGGFVFALSIALPATAQFSLPPGAILEVVRIADADGDGCLSTQEVTALLGNFGPALVAVFDTDADGLVCLSDLVASPLIPVDDVFGYVVQFADTNQSGDVSSIELRLIFPNLSDEQFDLLDANGDGVVSLADANPEDPIPFPDFTDLASVIVFLDTNRSGGISISEINRFIPGFTASMFAVLDTDGSGEVTQDEIEGLGAEELVPLALVLLCAIDTNRNAVIEASEAQAFIPILTPEILSMIDQNGDGALSVADLEGVLTDAIDIGVPLPIVDILQGILELYFTIDQNCDACFSLGEIQDMTGFFPEILFDVLDQDDDGLICTQDILALSSETIPDLLDEAIGSVDADGDGSVSFDEASALLPILTPQIFDYLDQNGDGLLSVEDLDSVLAPGFDPLEFLKGFYTEVDANADGCVSYDEVASVISEFPQPVFDLLDRNGDGNLCLEDAMLIGEDPSGLLDDVVAMIDPNGDGAVSFEEAEAVIPGLPFQVFDFLDMNGDGVLSRDDLDAVMFPPFFDPIDWLMDRYEEADTNGDGCLDFGEAGGLIPGLPEIVFGLIDLSDDGLVCLEEFADFDVDDALGILDEVIALVDTDGDGGISFEEALAEIPGLPRPVFLLLDFNDDGLLSVADVDPSNPPVFDPLDWLMEQYADADLDSDGCISLDEIQALVPDVPQFLFDALDRNDDGEVCLEEVKGLSRADIPEIVDELLDALDTDGDGLVSLEEARSVIPGLPRQVFRFLDVNGDGGLSRADLDIVLPPPPYDPLAELMKLYAQLDANGDGCTTYEELVAVVPGVPESLMQILDEGINRRPCLESVLYLGPDVVRALADAVLDMMDLDADGQLSYEEVSGAIPAVTTGIFEFLDQNGDGYLSMADIPAGFMGEPGNEWPKPPMNDPLALILWLFDVADANDDGAISFAEAGVVIPNLPERVFRILDANGDGFLTFEDVPIVGPEDPATRLLRLLDEVDADSNGEVTLEEIREIFPEFPPQGFIVLDVNQDGVLSQADLPDGPPQGPRERFLALLRQADADRNGEVTFDEFRLFRPELGELDFQRLDLDGNGVLSRNDLPDGEYDPIRLLAEILRDSDTDGDGQVTFEEMQMARPLLTPEQFARFDKNGDGVLTREDLPAPPDNSLERLVRLLDAADANEDGVVTFDELQAVAGNLTQEAFGRLDRNHDGIITSADLREGPPADPREALLALIRLADSDHDGQVTFEDVQAVNPEITTETFAEFDVNGDGVLSILDLPDAPVPGNDNLRRAMLQNLVRADTDHDGELDYAEIAFAFPDAPAELLALIDADHNWSISREELLAVLGQNDEGVPIVDVEDSDCDGQVTAADLQVIVNQALGRGSTILPMDVDGNGVIDILDIQRTVKKILTSVN